MRSYQRGAWENISKKQKSGNEELLERKKKRGEPEEWCLWKTKKWKEGKGRQIPYLEESVQEENDVDGHYGRSTKADHE